MHLNFQFGAEKAAVEYDNDRVTVKLNNPALGPQVERWDFPGTSIHVRSNFVTLQSDSLTIGAATVDVNAGDLETLTQELYESLLQNTQDLALYRMWHFVPAINHTPADQLENYQAFCKGRSLAFEALYHEQFHRALPAASAVGTTGNQLTIVYIAGTTPCIHLENPLQTPAYKYPLTYGPRPPSFARATVMQRSDGTELFISGTSSIRGSDSVGATTDEQTSATIENLQIIEREFARQYSSETLHLPRKVRVYLRDAEDQEIVHNQLTAEYLRPSDSVLYLQADICRRELNVEIEVSFNNDRTPESTL